MTTTIAHWEHFPHQADIGVRGIGETICQSIEQAAMALTAVICNPKEVRELKEVEVQCAAADLEVLLVEWLNALIYEMATRTMLFGRFYIYVCPDELGGAIELEALLWGEPIDVERHLPAVEVKGATHSELSVHQDAEGHWIAQCVVDV